MEHEPQHFEDTHVEQPASEAVDVNKVETGSGGDTDRLAHFSAAELRERYKNALNFKKAPRSGGIAERRQQRDKKFTLTDDQMREIDAFFSLEG